MEIDYKISQIYQKLAESANRITNFSVELLNKYLKSQNKNEQVITLDQKLSVSELAIKKIDKIISEDKKNLWSKQN